MTYVGFLFLPQPVAASSAAEIQLVIESYYDNDTLALRRTYGPLWVDSSRVRGTIDILWSCTVTLIACVYTALHLNVPRNHGMWAEFIKKIQWVLGALVAPEIVLSAAIMQFVEARRLWKELRRVVASRPVNERPDPSDYDLEFCFWVVMGGVRFDVADLIPDLTVLEPLDARSNWDTWWRRARLLRRIGPRGSYRALSPKGMIALAKLGFIPSMKQRIQDRSKANIFQKLLVLTQISWMLIQCSVRAALGLPISLLEIHILVHALCAMLMYAFWIRKPLDIHETETINRKEFTFDVTDVVAAMVELAFWEDHPIETIVFPPEAEADSPSTHSHLAEAVRFSPYPFSGGYEKVEPLFDSTGGLVLQSKQAATLETGHTVLCNAGEPRYFYKEDLLRLTRTSRFERLIATSNSLPHPSTITEADPRGISSSPRSRMHSFRLTNLGELEHCFRVPSNYPDIKSFAGLRPLSSINPIPAVQERFMNHIWVNFRRGLHIGANLLPILYGAVHLFPSSQPGSKVYYGKLPAFALRHTFLSVKLEHSWPSGWGS